MSNVIQKCSVYSLDDLGSTFTDFYWDELDNIKSLETFK